MTCCVYAARGMATRPNVIRRRVLCSGRVRRDATM
jgi:hypothetical protein